jgi:hypothetical protein
MVRVGLVSREEDRGYYGVGWGYYLCMLYSWYRMGLDII